MKTRFFFKRAEWLIGNLHNFSHFSNCDTLLISVAFHWALQCAAEDARGHRSRPAGTMPGGGAVQTQTGRRTDVNEWGRGDRPAAAAPSTAAVPTFFPVYGVQSVGRCRRPKRPRGRLLGAQREEKAWKMSKNHPRKMWNIFGPIHFFHQNTPSINKHLLIWTKTLKTRFVRERAPHKKIRGVGTTIGKFLLENSFDDLCLGRTDRQTDGITNIYYFLGVFFSM